MAETLELSGRDVSAEDADTEHDMAEDPPDYKSMLPSAQDDGKQIPTGPRPNGDTLVAGEKEHSVDITDGDRMIYNISESPPIGTTLFYALQQLLTSFSRTLTISLLITELVCGHKDEALKTRLLATTAMCNGISTILMATIGCRLPIYQGPAAAYIVPLIAMMSLEEWKCPEYNTLTSNSTSGNISQESYYEQYTEKRIQVLTGSLMMAGLFQVIVGATGLVGFLLRFIGPVTVVPTMTLVGIYVYKTVLKFVSTHWGIGSITCVIGIALPLYMKNIRAPLPWYNRKRGFHIAKSTYHRSFSVLIALIVGWIVSFILTETGVLTDDPDDPQYMSRTDSRLHVIKDTPWFLLPYPGQFGAPTFSTAVFVNFLFASIAAIIDSIGDYYACARTCLVPPPTPSAVNRGIATEGLMSMFAGACGIGHATTSFGGNIGVIGITRVASRRVFQVLGVLYILFALLGKVGAIFVTIPYAVLGGVQIISFGIFIGVCLSNLQYIDLSSTRNLAIIGITMLLGLMLPHWVAKTPDGIDTGVEDLDKLFKMLLANPAFACGIVACFLDNTVPGTREERGLQAWIIADTDKLPDSQKSHAEGYEVYDLPFLPSSWRWGNISRFIPIMPGFGDLKGRRSFQKTELSTESK